MPRAEAAVFLPADHPDRLPLAGGQAAVLDGLVEGIAGAVGAGVVHQIEGQGVAAGVFQHRGCGPQGLFPVVIGDDTG